MQKLRDFIQAKTDWPDASGHSSQDASLPLFDSHLAKQTMLTGRTALRVMIVEDSVEMRTRLVGLLQEVAGVEIVGQAEDEAGALALYDQHAPDAAVVDIRIRNGSGIAVLDHIKRHNPECVVIMLTNCAHFEFRQRCQDAGANHFLEKSREFSRVASLLRQLLRQKSTMPE